MVNERLKFNSRGTMATFRDAQIRRPLHSWLQRKFSEHLDTEILHELKMSRPSGRVDVAVINGRLCGFEIKSDFDNLSRLPRQVRAFSAIFDEVCVVTTKRHYKAAKKIIPEWWQLSVRSTKGGKASFRTVQKGRNNPSVKPDALLHMLTRSELLGVASERSIELSRRKLRRIEIINSLLNYLQLRDIQFEVRRILKIRAKTFTLRQTHTRRSSAGRTEFVDECGY